MRADRRTKDITKVIGAFRDSVNAPSKTIEMNCFAVIWNCLIIITAIMIIITDLCVLV